MTRRIAFGFLAPLWLAACAAGSSPAPAGDDCAAFTAPAFEVPSSFSGQNAFGHMLRLVCDFEARRPAIRDRSPGTPGRRAAASYSAEVLRLHGWRVWRKPFTGAEYLALEHGSVAAYLDPDRCPPGSLERVRELAFENVVAELGDGPQLWVLLAHYEAKRTASSDRDPDARALPVPGANDAASAVAVWLEASRLVVASPGVTFRILLVDGEDGFEDCHPLAGSIAYARSLDEAERARVSGVLLLDMVGDPAAEFCYSHDGPSLRDAVVAAARELAFAPLVEASDCAIVDDHTAFIDVGLPALGIVDWRGGSYPPYWHTLDDVPSNLSPPTLGAVGEVILRALSTLAGGG